MKLDISVREQTAFSNPYMLSLIVFIINLSLKRTNCLDVVSTLDSVVFGTL